MGLRGLATRGAPGKPWMRHTPARIRGKKVTGMKHVTLQARLLGEPRLVSDGHDVPVTPAGLRLLAFVLTRPGRRATRAQLVAGLGDAARESAARHRLNTAVWRLRRALEDAGAPRDMVVSTSTGLAIAPGCDLEVDIVEFERACRVPLVVSAWSGEDARGVERGLDLYAGEFMESVYDEWALAERGRLAEVHVSALLRMAQWRERSGDVDAALHYAECAAATEPLREDLQRALMHQYRRAGIPELAAQHYEGFRALLRAELDVEPLPETREAGLGHPVAGPGRADAATSKAVRDTLAELERTREQLRAITRHVEHSMNTLSAGLAGEPRHR